MARGSMVLTDIENNRPSERGNKNAKTCREKTLYVCESRVSNLCLVALVITQCLITLTILLIEVRVIQDPSEDSKTTKNKSSSESDVGERGQRSADSQTVDLVAQVLTYCSFTILAAFVIEVSIKIIAKGRSYFRHKGQVLDVFVVLVAFILDLALFVGGNIPSYYHALQLVVVLRLWRICRIIDYSTKRVQEYREATQAARGRVHNLEEKLEKQKQEIESLQEKLKQFEQYNRSVSESMSHSTQSLTSGGFDMHQFANRTSNDILHEATSEMIYHQSATLQRSDRNISSVVYQTAAGLGTWSGPGPGPGPGPQPDHHPTHDTRVAVGATQSDDDLSPESTTDNHPTHDTRVAVGADDQSPESTTDNHSRTRVVSVDANSHADFSDSNYQLSDPQQAERQDKIEDDTSGPSLQDSLSVEQRRLEGIVNTSFVLSEHAEVSAEFTREELEEIRRISEEQQAKGLVANTRESITYTNEEGIPMTSL